MNIVAPYKSDNLDKKISHDVHDRVEREGYVPNEKKIESFVQQGLVLTEYHGNAMEYDIPEEESEFEQDTKEYIDELTRQALEYEQPPLIQHLDKLTAEEVLDSADKAIEASKTNKPKKVEDPSTAVVNAIKQGFAAVSKSQSPKATATQ